jgi:predicted ATPase
LGYRVLEARCHDDEGVPPYWPWRQLLNTCARQFDQESLVSLVAADAPELARLSPVLRERLPRIAPTPSRESEEDRYELFQSVADFLLRVAEARPLYLTIDDAHWADLPSLQLLKFLAPYVARAPIDAMVTFRAD